MIRASRQPWFVLALCAACATARRPTLVGQSFDALISPLAGSAPIRTQAAGKVVLLDVWASWCGPCQQTLPLDAELQRELGSQGLLVVTLNVDADPREADAFLRGNKLQDQLTVLRDPEAKYVEGTFDLARLPTAYVVDRRGMVRYVESGYSAGTREHLHSMLAELLREPQP